MAKTRRDGKLDALGIDVVAETPEQFARFEADDVARNAALLKSVNFQPERPQAPLVSNTPLIESGYPEPKNWVPAFARFRGDERVVESHHPFSAAGMLLARFVA